MSRYDYPNACCRCAAEQPTKTWGVQSSESKPGAGNSIVTITYTSPVPVCDRCYQSLSMLWLCCAPKRDPAPLPVRTTSGHLV